MRKGDPLDYTFEIPENFLNPKEVRAFEIELFILSHPWISERYLDGKYDHKMTFIQFDYSDEAQRWRPTNTIHDGGFNCSREPYDGDGILLYTKGEEDFRICTACK